MTIGRRKVNNSRGELESTGETTGDAVYWFWLPVKLANPDINDEKLHSKISPVDFASPGEYLAEKPDKENECDFFFIHPMTWKSTGEKTGDAVYWLWLPVKLANPVIKDEKLHSKISPVDFASPGEYFAEKSGNWNECDFFFIHPVTQSQRVKKRVMWFVTATEMSLQTTNCTTIVAKRG